MSKKKETLDVKKEQDFEKAWKELILALVQLGVLKLKEKK